MLMSHDWRAIFCCQVHCNWPQLDMSSALKGLFKWCFCVEVPHVWSFNFSDPLEGLVSNWGKVFSFVIFLLSATIISLLRWHRWYFQQHYEMHTFSFEWVLIFIQANHKDRYSCDCTKKKSNLAHTECESCCCCFLPTPASQLFSPQLWWLSPVDGTAAKL